MALDRRDPASSWLWCEPADRAYAGVVPGSDPLQVEMTADPGHPESASELLTAVRREIHTGLLWTHGDLALSKTAAQAQRLNQVRELWLLERDLADIDELAPPPGVQLRSFDIDRDGEALLTLNSQVFADLPDQGSWGPAELQRHTAAPWFDPEGLLLAEESGELVGFHWTKIEPDQSEPVVGEVYVIGVAASNRGTGLSRALLAAGLQYLRERGAQRVRLFVDERNRAAIRLYLHAGFHHIDTDRQFSW